MEKFMGRNKRLVKCQDSDFYSGLLRSARNDDILFSSHVSRHCEARSNPE